jgi:Ca2+:H+ antiporter
LTTSNHSAWASSAVLLITYVCSLLFTLRTHKHLYDCADDPEECKPIRSIRYAAPILVLATVAVGVESEILVGSIEHVSQSLGLTELFIGVIVIALSAMPPSIARPSSWP